VEHSAGQLWTLTTGGRPLRRNAPVPVQAYARVFLVDMPWARCGPHQELNASGDWGREHPKGGPNLPLLLAFLPGARRARMFHVEHPKGSRASPSAAPLGSTWDPPHPDTDPDPGEGLRDNPRDARGFQS
jgi:hypothetical protein